MGNTVELNNIDDFIINDEFGASYNGGTKVWYSEKGYKEIANGAAVIATILSYYARGWEYFGSLCTHDPKKKESFIKYMYDVIGYVSPGLVGIMAGDLTRCAKKYTASREFVFTSSELAIPGDKLSRPANRVLARFIRSGLERDIPVAFYNMGSGHVENVAKNNWVIIIKMNMQSGIMDVLDNGKIVKIDFQKWLKKTKMGGFLAIIEPEFEDE